MIALASVLAAAAILLGLAPAPSARRLAALLPRARPPGPDPLTGPPAGDSGDQVTTVLLSPTMRLLTVALAGTSAGVVVGWPAGAVSAVVVAVGLPYAIVWARRRDAKAAEEREARALPLAQTLLASAVQSGAPIEAALVLCGLALRHPLGERLVLTGRALQLGATPQEALTDLRSGSSTKALAHLLQSSLTDGVAPARALHDAAVQVRRRSLRIGEQRARSAGARAAAPLGLCFLPAFVVVGVVPLVASAGLQLLR